MHKTQIAFWVSIICICSEFFVSTGLYARSAPPQQRPSPPLQRQNLEHPTEHIPQSQFPAHVSSPSPTAGVLPSSSAFVTPTATMSPIATPAATSAMESSQGSNDSENPAQTIDLSQFPATAVDEVVVPMPSEIFNVLDKMGSPNWKEYFPASFGKNTGDRAQIALLLGSVIADGFVAVEGEDPEKVKEVGREVLALADAINVRKAVIARSKSIIEKADTKDWTAVRKELDGALQDVRTAMQELNDDDIAQLVSLGGWLQGTRVLTSIVKKNYNVQFADLLHQPELINYFLRRIDSMPRRLQKSQYVDPIRNALKQIRPLVQSDQISEASVEKINQLTYDTVSKFTSQ